jgi:hypothetical protein
LIKRGDNAVEGGVFIDAGMNGVGLKTHTRFCSWCETLHEIKNLF